MERLGAQELRVWREDRTTRKVLLKLQDKSDEFSTNLCNGSAFNMDPDKPGSPLWIAGYLKGITEILEIEPDEAEDGKEKDDDRG